MCKWLLKNMDVKTSKAFSRRRDILKPVADGHQTSTAFTTLVPRSELQDEESSRSWHRSHYLSPGDNYPPSRSRSQSRERHSRTLPMARKRRLTASPRPRPSPEPPQYPTEEGLSLGRWLDFSTEFHTSSVQRSDLDPSGTHPTSQFAGRLRNTTRNTR